MRLSALWTVEAFECKEEGGVDNYVCKVEDIELIFEDSEEDEDEKEEKDRVERRMDSEEEEEEVEKRTGEREKDESGGDTEREENVEEVMDQRLKKHISQKHNYAQDLKVEDNGRGSESVAVNMNMVKAESLTVVEAVDSEKKRRK